MRFAKQLAIGGRELRLQLETTRIIRRKETKPKPPLFPGIRAIGVLSLLVLGVVVWTSFGRDFSPKEIADVSEFPHHLRARVIAMEFIETPDQLSAILGGDNGELSAHNVQAMRDEIRRDFFFIASYALLYVALSLLLARRRNRWAVYLAWLAGVLGVATALFDVRENFAILNLLNAQTVEQQKIAVSTVHLAAMVKWTLGFVTVAVLALAFYGRGDPWLTLIGYLLTLTAGLGLVGIWRLPYIQFAFLPMFGALLLLLILTVAQPRKFVEDFY